MTSHGWPPGQGPDRAARLVGERLTGLPGVLREQQLDLPSREVSEPQGPGPHVEGAAAGNERVLGGRVDAVIAHPAQNDALREPARAVRVAGAELAQHREQGVADEGVDLVDDEHQRLRARCGPAGQGLPQRLARTGRIEDAEPRPGDEPVVESQCAQDGADGRSHVLASGLADLDVDAAQYTIRVQRVAESKQRRGLSGLARCVQDEVLVLPDEQQELVDVQALQGRHAVVHVRDDGASGVEEAHVRSAARPRRFHRYGRSPPRAVLAHRHPESIGRLRMVVSQPTSR